MPARKGKSTEPALEPKDAKPPDELVMQARLLKQDGKDYYSSRNHMIREMRERRFLERPVSIPKAFRGTTREVRLPILADTIELMVAICDGAKPTVKVDPYDVGIKAERNSSLRERWSESALDQAERDLQRKSRTMARENQIADGLGVLKVVYRGDSWKEIPDAQKLFGKPEAEIDTAESGKLLKAQELAKKGARLPFTIIDVDPMTFFPGYGPDGDLDYAIEIQERKSLPVLASYSSQIKVDSAGNIAPRTVIGEGTPIDERAGTPSSTVEVWEYWDREQHLTFVEDVCVKYARHDTGQVPYFHCYAKPSASRDPERRTRPPLHKTNWLLDLLDSFWTMMSNAGYLYSYPTPVTITPVNAQVPMAEDGKPRSAKFEVGRHMNLYQGQEFKFLTPPAEHLQLMAQLINQATRVFETSSGLGPAVKGLTGSDASGYQVNQLIQASMLSLQPAIDAYDWMLAGAIAYIWRLIERRIKDDVWVMGTNPDPDEKGQKWLALGPDDIKGYYRCKVHSKPLVSQQRIAQGAFAADMVKGGLLDRRRAIEEYLGYENEADDILDAIEIDKIMSAGPFHDMIIFNAMKRAGIPMSPPSGMQPPGPAPMPGMENAGTGFPGQGPLGPGLGNQLNPPPPPPPGMTAEQLQGAGGIAMPGRPGGVERQPPMQNNPSIQNPI